MRAALSVLGLAGLGFAVTVALAGPASACRGSSCVGGGNDGAFRGSAAVTEKGKVYSPGKSGGGSSTNTLWKVMGMCESLQSGPNPHPCAGQYAPGKCPAPNEDQDKKLLNYWVPGTGWNAAATWCPTEGKPHSIEEIALTRKGEWEQKLPKLDPKMQPDKNNKTLIGLKTYFRSGQNDGQIRPFEAGLTPMWGLNIQLLADPVKWDWQFEGPGGPTVAFPISGSTYQDKGPLNYTYNALGPKEPTVGAEWKGRLIVNGKGPFEIATHAFQKPVSLPIQVVEKVDVLSGK